MGEDFLNQTSERKFFSSQNREELAVQELNIEPCGKAKV